MRSQESGKGSVDQLLRLAVGASSSPLLVLDENACCQYLNEAAERATGYTLAELDGRSLPEAIGLHRAKDTWYPEDACPFRLALEKGETKHGVDYFLCKEGSARRIWYTVTPLEENDRTVGAAVEVRVASTAEDRDQLDPSTFVGADETEVYYQVLLNSMNQGFFVCEIILDEARRPIDYLFIETNPSFERLTGLADAKGKTARELVPDLETHWFDIYGNVALTGEPVHVTEESAALERWFDVYAFRIGGAESLRVGALFTDITQKKMAEEERNRLVEALKLERTRLETVFEEAPAAIATLRGPNHVFEMANRLYYQLVDKHELIGKPAREVFPELTGEGIFELLDHVYSTGEPFVARGMYVPIKRDSDDQRRDYYLDFVYQPLREPDGSISGIFAHAVDVTEHKKAVAALAEAHNLMEERVEERTSELRALNLELESFNYSVSHDLRAPLRAITGFSQVLLEEHGRSLNEEGQNFLSRIRAASSRMSELIDDLLKLSQLTRADVRRRKFDLSELARSVTADLLDREGEKVRARIQVADGMTAFGDPSLLRIAIENLLDNAVKFSQRRDDALIEVGVSGEDNKVFFVRDNGAGFPMDQSERLFVPFQRLHSNEFSGSGIGLATVERIVHKHGGMIWAEGAPDKGATFYFTLTRQIKKG